MPCRYKDFKRYYAVSVTDGAFGVMYYLLGKNIQISRILIGIVVVSILGAYLNILG